MSLKKDIIIKLYNLTLDTLTSYLTIGRSDNYVEPYDQIELDKFMNNNKVNILNFVNYIYEELKEDPSEFEDFEQRDIWEFDINKFIKIPEHDESKPYL